MIEKDIDKELNLFVNGVIKKLLIFGGLIAIIIYVLGDKLSALGFLAGVIIAAINFRVMSKNVINNKFKNLKKAAVKSFFIRYGLIFVVVALFVTVKKVSAVAVLCGLLTLPVFLLFGYGKGKK